MKRCVSVCMLSILLCVTAPLAQAGRNIPLPRFENEVILNTPSQDAEKIVHDAILVGAAKKTWAVVSDDGKTVRLSIDVRNKHQVVVDVRIQGNAVTIDYVSSLNMGYRDDGNGESIRSGYVGWIVNLLNAARKAANPD